MKIYAIKASAPGPFKEYKKAMGAPPQSIFSLAAATPKGIEIRLCDETVDMRPDMGTDADMVVLLFHTPDAVHAYTLADRFKEKGKAIVMGGLHPSAEPKEALAHADAVMIGETEEIWEALLNDFKDNCLKKIYQRETPVDLALINPYPTDLIPPSKYNHFWSVLVSRGCVHRCDFCAVPPFFKGKYRLRPIEHIVEEIKSVPTDWFELHADNLTANREYALELFKALTPLKINWVGEATTKLADDDELLKAAAESGCKELLIGIETPSQSALKASGKGFVSPEDLKEKIKRFHDYGIRITSSMIFGFDTHTTDIFKESEDFCRYVGLDEVEAVILIPFPGTPLYKRLANENRLISQDWSKFDGSHAVFKPALMTCEELEQGTHRFWKEIQKKKPVPTTWTGSPGKKPPSSGSNTTSRSGPVLTAAPRRVRWKSILALGLIGAGVWFEWYWIWGILALIWGITDLKNRHTYLLEDIPRDQAPVLYWVVVLMWLSLGIWGILIPFQGAG